MLPCNTKVERSAAAVYECGNVMLCDVMLYSAEVECNAVALEVLFKA